MELEIRIRRLQLLERADWSCRNKNKIRNYYRNKLTPVVASVRLRGVVVHNLFTRRRPLHVA